MPRIVFALPDGTRREIEARAGQTVLDIAWEHGIDIEGACEAQMACSTCHVILSDADYDRLPPSTDDEEDMLDLAWGVTPNSRLGCQILITEDHDGLTLILPAETVNHMG